MASSKTGGTICCCLCSTISFLIVALGITAICLWQFVGFETPGTNYDIQLDGEGLLDPLAYSKGLPVEVNVQVTNPNSYSLKANDIKAVLEVPEAGNTKIATVTHPGEVAIPREDNRTFDMTGYVKYSTEVALLLAKECTESRDNTIAVDTIVSFKVWSMFPVTLPTYSSSLGCGDLLDAVGDKVGDTLDKVTDARKVPSDIETTKATTKINAKEETVVVVDYKDIHIPGQKLPLKFTESKVEEAKGSQTNENGNSNLRKRL